MDGMCIKHMNFIKSKRMERDRLQLFCEDGTVVEGRGLHIGAHAKDNNRDTIGICMTGNFDKYDPTTAQMNALYSLCKMFMKQFAIKKEKYTRSQELEGVTKSCPGKRFSMVELRNVLSYI